MGTVSRIASLIAVATAACAGPPPPEAPTSPPRDLGQAIRAAVGEWDARYFDAAVDLDGDGKDEVVAYVAGPDVCGTGGCPVYVFAPKDGGYRLVSSISVSQVPVRVSANKTNGWRDLVVDIGGGGASPGHRVLKFDGTGYPENPTVPPAESLSNLDGTEVLIPEFETFTDGKPLPE